jgi:hypothetical protein
MTNAVAKMELGSASKKFNSFPTDLGCDTLAPRLNGFGQTSEPTKKRPDALGST